MTRGRKKNPPWALPHIYCDLPNEGEALSSWLDRNSQRYGQSRKRIIVSLGEKLQLSWDFDAFDCWLVRGSFFRATGLTWRDLAPYAISPPERDWLLQPKLRNLYCPLCFAEDLAGEHTPYFRLDWARVLLTHCSRHRSPLFIWHDVWNDGSRMLPKAWLTRPTYEQLDASPNLVEDIRATKSLAKSLGQNPESKEVWDTLLTFERACLTYDNYGVGRDVPINPAQSLGAVCRLLVLVLRGTKRQDRVRWIADELCPAFVDGDILDFNPEQLRQTTLEQAWRLSVRALADPGTRRAALWVVAHTFSGLSPRTKLRSGRFASAGHTPGWLEDMSLVCGSRAAVDSAFRKDPSNHLLQPRQYSHPRGRVPAFWDSEHAF